LLASFKSTLEEVIDASLLVIVVDAADPERLV
jgi:50S ribosomal subunit-associated GTPase HflX